jgi:hypothetical protein
MEYFYSLYRFDRGSIIEMRNLFNKALLSKEVEMMSTEKAMLEETSRVLSVVVNNTLFNVNRKIIRFISKLKGNISALSANTE